MGELFEAGNLEYVISESNGKLRVGGTFQLADERNANNRIYPRKLWERVLGDNSVREKIESRRMVGMLGHPSSGETDPEKISHVITKLEMVGNKIYGEAEIIPTPCGKILESLLKCGVKLGISSRGSGEVENLNGMNYVKEDYKLKTFDFVLDPSTPGAFPSTLESAEVALSTINREWSNPNLRVEEARVYRQLVESIEHHTDPTIRYKAHLLAESMDSRISTALIGTTHKEGNRMVAETTDLKSLYEDKLRYADEQFAKEREELHAKIQEQEETIGHLSNQVEALSQKLESAVQLGDELVIQYKNAAMKSGHFQNQVEGLAELPQRYEAAKAIIESLIGRLKGMSETARRYNAAVKLIAEMVKISKNGQMGRVMESELSRVPESKRDAARVIVEGCASPEEVKAKIKAFLGETAAPPKAKRQGVPENLPLNRPDNLVEEKKDQSDYQSFLSGLTAKVSGR